MAYVQGGYKTLSPIQICNALGALQAGLISLRGFRIFFACAAELAAREAAARVAARLGCQRGASRPRYLVEKIGRSIHCTSLRTVRSDLHRLEAACLLRFSAEAVVFAREPIPAAESLLARSSAERSPTRAVPLTRPVLRLLARPGAASTAKVVLAYHLRGLTRDARTGEVRGRGSVKASWIAEVFGMSLRAVRAGRAEIVRLGLIERDRGSSQWKLNRTGSYFAWNLAWPGASSTAPLVAVAASNPAPPIKRPGTPYGSEKYQEPAGPGAFSKPDIRDVTPEDLRQLPRLDELYQQAVRRRLLDGTESDALNFLCAAVRAVSVECRAPEKVFMGIVRKRLWGNATQGQEDRAREGLHRARRQHPGAFTVTTPRIPSRAALNTGPEARLSRAEIRSLIERSLRVAA